MRPGVHETCELIRGCATAVMVFVIVALFTLLAGARP